MNIVSDAVVEQLARTKGWTLFFSVMLWIAVGLLSIVGLIMFVVMLGAGGSMGNLEGLAGGAGMGALMGGMYLIIAALYAYPALKLGNFSGRITDLLQDPTESNLVAALIEQRRFWKYVGIAMIIYLGLIALVFVGALIAGIAAGAAGT